MGNSIEYMLYIYFALAMYLHESKEVCRNIKYVVLMKLILHDEKWFVPYSQFCNAYLKDLGCRLDLGGCSGHGGQSAPPLCHGKAGLPSADQTGARRGTEKSPPSLGAEILVLRYFHCMRRLGSPGPRPMDLDEKLEDRLNSSSNPRVLQWDIANYHFHSQPEVPMHDA